MSKEIKNLPKDFDLNHQWGLFCERCQIPENKMPEDQRREMKRAFMGACAQMLLLYKDDLGKYAEDNGPRAAIFVLQNLLDQCEVYWKNEMEKQIDKNNSKN
jgi:hypothetical protein